MDINAWIMTHEKAIRMGFFFGMLVIIGLWEVLAPRRVPKLSKLLRWSNNLGLVFFNSFVVRLLFPAAAVGVASIAIQHQWGLFNNLHWPVWAAILVSVVILDFIIYMQHVMVHAVPLFWRLHRVHHADPDFDVTTGARFHTVEILLSMLIKFAAIVLLGPPVIAVVIFEVLLNATAMFNHGNIRLPLAVDRILRWFIVTPDMHRVHHSVEDDETNSNFGFNLSIWDRVFGTYRAQPRKAHEEMEIGIHRYNKPKEVSWLTGMLFLPFKGKVSEYAINRRQWSGDED